MLVLGLSWRTVMLCCLRLSDTHRLIAMTESTRQYCAVYGTKNMSILNEVICISNIELLY